MKFLLFLRTRIGLQFYVITFVNNFDMVKKKLEVDGEQ